MPWYKEWFESPLHDLLYKHRDEDEAYAFITALKNTLEPTQGSNILDLACGNGRHSVALSKFGKVHGVDLSEKQIGKAKERNIPNAEFFIHDMRKVVKENHFHYIFNLFSSFGYFEDQIENQKVLDSVCLSLKSKGIFIQDYLNSEHVSKNLIAKDDVLTGDYIFRIERKIENNFVVKQINVFQSITEEPVGVFFEKVRMYSKSELEAMHTQAGLQILNVFGNYDLNHFDMTNSPRLILISQKIK